MRGGKNMKRDNPGKHEHSCRGLTVILILGLLLSLSPITSVEAATEILAKAKPDECFYGVGSPANTFFFNYTMEQAAQMVQGCPASVGPLAQGGEILNLIPKVNDGYIWGLAKAGDNIFFGTVSNTPCLIADTYFTGFPGVGTCNTVLNKFYVCESCKREAFPAGSDWRPPRIFMYNAQNGLVEKTPLLSSPNPANRDPLINQTLGLRSAGKLGNKVVVLAGPSIGTFNPILGPVGINLFAFDSLNGDYLGSTTLPDYDDIRKWVEVRGAVYTGVHNTLGGGSILRWTGKLVYNNGKPDLNALFQFEQVGITDSQPAFIVEHQGSLFVTTWPYLERRIDPTKKVLAGLYKSPVMGLGGLTKAHANKWKKVWDVSRYEPDQVAAATYTLGALASYGGYLYWGSMHVPGLATLAHFLYFADDYGPTGPTPEQQQVVTQKLDRASSLFRGVFTPAGNFVQLLYGEKTLPTYTPILKIWRNARTRAGAPLFGPSGFSNPFNRYVWTMAVHQKKLYVGTGESSLPEYYTLFPNAPFPSPTPNGFGNGFGCDLWVFNNTRSPAVPVHLEGMGNVLNYGIRTMYSDGDALYLGTANPMNLSTDPALPQAQGGWELIKYQP